MTVNDYANARYALFVDGANAHATCARQAPTRRAQQEAPVELGPRHLSLARWGR
jgi:hypothetical protein